jgi:hypothetical protein
MAWDRQKYDIPGLWYGTSDFLARYMFFFAPDIKLIFMLIYSFTVTFGAKYLTDMVTSVPPYETLVLFKIIFFISLKTTKITSKIQISEVCDL